MDRYVVIKEFIDLTDGYESHYKVGNIYPRAGVEVPEERIKELSTSYNKQKRALIMPLTELEPIEVKEEAPVEEAPVEEAPVEEETEKKTTRKKVVKDVKED